MGPNFLAVVTVVTGVAGAVCSLVLWLYQAQPANSLLGSYAWEVAHGGPLRTNLIELALVLGIVAITAGLLSTVGSREAPVSVPIGLVLGLMALSYPVMEMLHIVGTPVPVVLFR
jgi:hypothetical protein